MSERPGDQRSMYRAAIMGASLTPVERVAVQKWMERDHGGRTSKAFLSAKRKILKFGR